MTAQKKGRLYQRKVNKSSKKIELSFNFKLVVGLVIALPLVIFLAWILLTKGRYWDGETRLSMAVRQDNDDVILAVFDPQAETITSISIAKDTQVSASHNFGEWRLGSLWYLAEDEGLTGELISNSITKTFQFPTEAWSDVPGNGFINGRLISVIKSVFKPYSTNLNLKDKVSLALFSLKVSNTSKITYDLKNAGYLVLKKLPDGEEGYVASGLPPARLTAIFADEKVSNEKSSVLIMNGMSNSAKAKQVGKIVEVLGTKVISIQEYSYDGKCMVAGSQKYTIEEISDIFHCKKEFNSDESVKLYLGPEFDEEF